MKNQEEKSVSDEKVRDNPEAIIQQLRSMLESYLSNMDRTALSEEDKSSWAAMVSRLTKEKRKAVIAMIPPLDDTQKRLQVDYLRVSILLQDIERTAQSFDAAMQAGNFNEGLRELRIGLLAYYLSNDARNKLSRYGKDDNEIRELSKELAPRTTFLAHLRNYITGHLDDVVLGKTCQWGGFSIFTKSAMTNSSLMLLVNKYLLETGINCCIASKPDDKNVIKNELDLTCPPDYTYFMKFMSETYKLTVDFLSKVKVKIESQLNPYEEKESMMRALWAGETDFNVN